MRCREVQVGGGCDRRANEHGARTERCRRRDVAHAIAHVETAREVQLVHRGSALVQLSGRLSAGTWSRKVRMVRAGKRVAQLGTLATQKVVEPLAYRAILCNRNPTACDP